MLVSNGPGELATWVRPLALELHNRLALRPGKLYLNLVPAGRKKSGESLDLPLVVGAIASCRPEDADFPDYLERQKANPLVKGFRRVLHVMPDALSEQPVFRENIRKMTGSGLTFDLCVLP